MYVCVRARMRTRERRVVKVMSGKRRGRGREGGEHYRIKKEVDEKE